MSFNERRAGANKHPWTLPQLSENDELTRPMTHALPGNKSKLGSHTMGRAELARRKSDYFDEAFPVRGDRHPLRERIHGDSMVMVELKTNVIVSHFARYRHSKYAIIIVLPLTWMSRSATSSSSSPS